jgi:hypothetical protein
MSLKEPLPAIDVRFKKPRSLDFWQKFGRLLSGAIRIELFTLPGFPYTSTIVLGGRISVSWVLASAYKIIYR